MNHEQTQQSSSPGKRLMIAVGLGLGALILGVWFASRPDSAPSIAEPIEEAREGGLIELSSEAQRNANLKFADVEERPLEAMLVATGVVAPDQNRIAHVRPPAQGIAEQVHAQLGDRVRAGQPLLTYDNIELGELIGEYLTTQAEIKREQSQVEVARSYLNRAESLLAAEAIAQKELELRKAEYDQAVATVESRKAELARVEEKIHRFGLTDEDLKNLNSSEHDPHRTASHTTLTAPFAGVITAQDVAAGETIGPDSEVFTLADASIVWVLADIYEKDLGQLGVGQACRVTVTAYPGQVFTGKITYIGDVLDPQSRTSKLRCVVDNPAGRLKLEMFATVELPAAQQRVALAVPGAALQQVDADTVVFVQRGPALFEKRVVQVGGRGGEWVELLSGVQKGEKIVTTGSFYVKSALLREQIGGED